MARIVAISDFCAPLPVDPPTRNHAACRARWRAIAAEPRPPCGPAKVCGGYLERLPLAAVAAGLCRQRRDLELCRQRPAGRSDAGLRSADPAPLSRRRPRPLPLGRPLAHLDVFGAPAILCTWGLGVDAAILARCAASVRVYNSIDAPALRIPAEVSRHVDLFLASAPWQAEAIRVRHPGALVAVMPIGPEFASPETFFPTGAAKDFDVIYVAAAQGYKRHDILLDAFARLPRGIRGLCVFGYGEDAEAIRAEIGARGLNINCIGPPGVPYAQVNALMNRARIGVVCGEDGRRAGDPHRVHARGPAGARQRPPPLRPRLHPAGHRSRGAGRAFADAILSLLARAPAHGAARRGPRTLGLGEND